MKIFVDTSAFIALTNKSDKYHIKAKNFVTKLKMPYEFYTTNYILDEAITRIRMYVSHNSACKFGDRIFKSKLYKIYYIDKEIEKEAWSLFQKYKDKLFSFTDCTSFVIMKKFNIYNAFTFDKNFQQMGFNILPV